MANQLTTPNVLRLDTAAVIDATNQFKIRKIRLMAGATASAAQLKNGAGQIIAELATAASPANPDEIDWSSQSWPVKGLELASISPATAVLYIYCQ